MKNSKSRKLIILSAAVLIFSLLACAAASGLPESGAEAPAPAEASASPEASPLPSGEPESFHERIEQLKLSLPEPPELDIHSWEFLVANSYNGITRYAPPYGNLNGQGLDARIVEDTALFIEAARNAGYSVYIYQGYRNYDFQSYNFESYLLQYGSAWEAAKHFEPQSTSEHQTGLAIDVTDIMDYAGSYDILDNSPFTQTEAYEWMCEHCQEYGFIVRYPAGKEMYSGYACRNGHFRYVGREAAEYIMENGICLEEFIGLYDEEAVYVPDYVFAAG